MVGSAVPGLKRKRFERILLKFNNDDNVDIG